MASAQAHPRHLGHRWAGFTLIELLVAIALMALMALLGWRGLDGISRSQQQLRSHADGLQTLQATLTQWGADLDAMVAQPGLPGLDWDGRALRILRQDVQANPAEPALRVVAWSWRAGAGQWLRWQSPPLQNRPDLDLAWQQAAQWAQNPGDAERRHEVSTLALSGWQVFYYRANAWTNPLSSAAEAEGAAVLPDGVRLVLTLAPGQALGGVLTRDWVRPVLGGAR